MIGYISKRQLTSAVNHGGKLEAEALAEGGGRLDEDIVVIESRLDDLFLEGPRKR